MRVGPGVARVSKEVYLRCFASELVLASFKGLSPNSREVVLDQCQNQRFRKAFALEMPK